MILLFEISPKKLVVYGPGRKNDPWWEFFRKCFAGWTAFDSLCDNGSVPTTVWYITIYAGSFNSIRITKYWRHLVSTPSVNDDELTSISASRLYPLGESNKVMVNEPTQHIACIPLSNATWHDSTFHSDKVRFTFQRHKPLLWHQHLLLYSITSC